MIHLYLLYLCIFSLIFTFLLSLLQCRLHCSSPPIAEIHNHIFGQLGNIALTMHDIGLSDAEVEAALVQLCRSTQLTEDQEIQLVTNTR